MKTRRSTVYIILQTDKSLHTTLTPTTDRSNRSERDWKSVACASTEYYWLGVDRSKERAARNPERGRVRGRETI